MTKGPVRHVGVDLAWGTRNPTGLAVVDGEGRLLDVGRAVDEDDVVSWLLPHTLGACRVGIDAPVVVEDLTGMRACEREVGRHFGRFGASCRPSNASMPLFAGGTRAQRLADALDLAVDPDGAADRPGARPVDRARRRVDEVYPHQAMVAIFGLPRVLRYKAGAGRDLAGLRAELLRLMDLLESLAHPPADGVAGGVPLDVRACPGWERLRADVRAATTKAALRRCEDPVDAVVCAYVVRLADVRPERVRLLGDRTRGRILTVVTPEIAARVDADGRGSGVLRDGARRDGAAAVRAGGDAG